MEITLTTREAAAAHEQVCNAVHLHAIEVLERLRLLAVTHLPVAVCKLEEPACAVFVGPEFGHARNGG